VASYLCLALLTDSFDFTFLQEKSQSNLMNVDLRANSLLTLLTKLRLKECTDKSERNSLMAALVWCAFYRAVCFG